MKRHKEGGSMKERKQITLRLPDGVYEALKEEAEGGDVRNMTKEKEVKLTYRLGKSLYEKIVKSAKEKHISVNAEINWILFQHYMKN